MRTLSFFGWVPVAGALALVACGPSADDPGDDALSPHAVQGPGPASPLTGDDVEVRGIVTVDAQDGDANDELDLGGFYLQSLDADDDPRTSEGLFVYDADIDGPDVAAGDVVVARGTVVEFHGETQLAAAHVVVEQRRAPRAESLPLPAAAVTVNSGGEPIADLEAFEGQLVRVPGTLYVRDLYGLERFGELLLSTEPREYSFTTIARPDPAAFAAHREQLAARTLTLDDGKRAENRRPGRWQAAHDGSRAPRIGDAVSGLTGTLRYSRGSGDAGTETWRLVPLTPPVFAAANPRPAPPRPGGTVVASVNLLNYFTTPGSRGADTAAEFERQRAKTAAAIRALEADVVAVMELENNPREAIADLAAALGGDWRYVDTGPVGDDAIRVALLYRTDRATPAGEHAILDASVDPRFDSQQNRPVLAQTFDAGNGRFTVAVAHLKSKGSPCDEAGDPDRGDGQGNCSVTRTRAAEALADWLQDDPTGSGDPDVLLVGDLNAYRYEDPPAALEAAGYLSLHVATADLPPYSYVFRGESGALDHAFASPSLATQVTGAAAWHANADEAAIYDYNLDHGRDPALFDATVPWRAADHDPLVVGLDLDPR